MTGVPRGLPGWGLVRMLVSQAAYSVGISAVVIVGRHLVQVRVFLVADIS